MKLDEPEDVAKAAYELFRGMKIEAPFDPHWDDVSRQDKARFEWMIRFDRMKSAS